MTILFLIDISLWINRSNTGLFPCCVEHHSQARVQVAHDVVHAHQAAQTLGVLRLDLGRLRSGSCGNIMILVTKTMDNLRFLNFQPWII